MAYWRVSNAERRSVAEREIWNHPDKGVIVREMLLTHGAYLIVTEDDNPPVFVREAVPGGDGAEDSVDMNCCGYESRPIELGSSCNLLITWPEDMADGEKEELLDAWEEDMHEAWENEDWSLDDIEVWFWGALDVEKVDPSEFGVQSSREDESNAWNESQTQPDAMGVYAIETVEKVVWPNFPVTQACWNGSEWLDENGSSIQVKKWKKIDLN